MAIALGREHLDALEYERLLDALEYERLLDALEYERSSACRLQ